MEHRLRRKQLNSDSNASNKTYLKEIQEKRKEEKRLKNQKMKIGTKNAKKMKNKKQEKRQRNGRKKKEEKKGKKPQRVPPEMGRKIDFLRNVQRNRNEIESQKKSDFVHPTKKMKENERK